MGTYPLLYNIFKPAFLFFTGWTGQARRFFQQQAFLQGVNTVRFAYLLFLPELLFPDTEVLF